jgi:putative isomerase
MIIAQEYSLFIAEKLEQLTITDLANKQVLDLSLAKNSRISKPGELQQTFTFEKFTLELSLHFVSSRTAMIETQLINHSNDKLDLALTWQGELLEKWDDKKIVKQALPQ